VTNIEIAEIFQDIANLLKLKGDNVFKIRAYQNAARVIEDLPKELIVMHEEGEDLKSIPGIGEAIAKKTIELLITGKLVFYENLKAESPGGSEPPDIVAKQ
jgi:DNA polymerase (family 10)